MKNLYHFILFNIFSISMTQAMIFVPMKELLTQRYIKERAATKNQYASLLSYDLEKNAVSVYYKNNNLELKAVLNIKKFHIIIERLLKLQHNFELPILITLCKKTTYNEPLTASDIEAFKKTITTLIYYGFLTI